MKSVLPVTALSILTCVGGLLAIHLASAQQAALPDIRGTSGSAVAGQAPQGVALEPAARPAIPRYYPQAAPQAENIPYAPFPGAYPNQNVARYAPAGVPMADPAAAKLHQAEVVAAREAAALAGQLNTVSSDTARAEIRGRLREALVRQFAAQQQRRSREIAAIEERLAALKETLSKRDAASDAIVDRRLNQLTGVADELGWEETGLEPSAYGLAVPAQIPNRMPPEAGAHQPTAPVPPMSPSPAPAPAARSLAAPAAAALAPAAPAAPAAPDPRTAPPAAANPVGPSAFPALPATPAPATAPTTTPAETSELPGGGAPLEAK